jgi:superfamily II DNA or RNA helicase/very-short-patch-repair endonuclease
MESTQRIDRYSPPEDKIRLFRSLFRGREDVYPRRFESRRTGKAGYSPACANEWIKNVCEKPKVKCSNCRFQHFLPITDDVIRFHLSGHDDHGWDFTMGIYPMLLDETCFFVAADFDKATWLDDGKAFLETCRSLEIPAVLERSRSGNGGHIWFFFEEAVPAVLARKLGSYILTETMERRPDLGLDSYDRLFPNQDTLPKGGFGSLIALPLQNKPRKLGNSVFLHDTATPFCDQWSFLSGIRRISRDEIEGIVRKAEAKGQVVGVRCYPVDEEEEDTLWTSSASPSLKAIAGPLPQNLELILSNEIYIAKEHLPPALRNRLVRLAAFQNPEFYRAQAMRLPTYDMPRVVGCARDYPRHLGLPRGCQADLLQTLSDLTIPCSTRDERCQGDPLSVSFHGELRPEQRVAAEAMLAHETGVLSATPAFGKTVIAAWIIAQRAVNTLVLVHRRQLQEQWIEALSRFLKLPAKAIGRIGGGHKVQTGLIDVATIQSLVKKGSVDETIARYGHLVVDECHHLSAYNFEQVARSAKARFVTGLSATVTRKDGHHPIIFMQCGPVRHRVDAKAQAASRPFDHLVLVRPTGFRSLRVPNADLRVQYSELMDELTSADVRTRQICRDVVRAMQDGRSPLVLTERNDHLDLLAARLSPDVQHVVVLRGGMGSKEVAKTRARLAAIPDSEWRILLATGRYAGEGFDDCRLDTLFLTLPVSWRGTIAQYVGRLHRLHNGKREVRVYDYADLDVPMLARMFDRRCKGYEAVGYTIRLPGSAMPGWPSEIELPDDSLWKSEYAASVRRLALDGVDAPLAELFARAAANLSTNEDGPSRARSAGEQFLFRRLETLPQTSGRFRLNAELPIPFDGWGRMEVDLLCEDARIAVELDGAQHLESTEAYRRDRHKDAVLQEHGYLVLRFLAEDVTKRLDDVLHGILRALAHRTRRPPVSERPSLFKIV